MDPAGISKWWLPKFLLSLALILYGATVAILRPGAVSFSSMLAGALLLSADAPATLLLSLFLLTLPPLVRDEDRMMARAFPDQFPQWAARTRRLFPGIY